jgi:hypothetical protein
MIIYLKTDEYTDMPENAETEKVKSNIQKWLLEDGYKIESQPDQNTLFRFIATDKSGIKTIIVQPTLMLDQIVIGAGINVDNVQQSLLQTLENKERLDFLWDLRFGLLNLDVGFHGISLPLEKIEISKTIYYDGLTKDALLQKVSNVTRAVIFAKWTFDRKFGEAKPKSDLMVR